MTLYVNSKGYSKKIFVEVDIFLRQQRKYEMDRPEHTDIITHSRFNIRGQLISDARRHFGVVVTSTAVTFNLTKSALDLFRLQVRNHSFHYSVQFQLLLQR
jgi:hypothetical protein